ncbi:MAG TPA: hypothetical protein VNL95_04545 [Dehalococcoidia bacterium]|nr:hypothetical protein [Dehalococcoidia bacterium]
MALAIKKRGRECIVAKVVPADGELVLAVVYRHRPRLRGYISLPPAVLRRARERGARALIVRDDRQRRAWRLPLALVGVVGRRRRDGEVYIPLQAMEEIDPPSWPYVARVELLEDEEEGQQLPLLEGAGR